MDRDDPADRGQADDSQPASRSDLIPWYVAAALFWFEGVGLLGLGAAVTMSPFLCWGHPGEAAPASDPCASGRLPFVDDGGAVVWLIVLLAIGSFVAVLWALTDTHRRARATALLGLGLACLLPITLAAALGNIAFLALLVLWTGIPAVLLVGSAVRLFRADPSRPA